MNEEHFKNKALAEELSQSLDEPENIGLYYKLAQQEPHDLLRGILSWVKDYSKPERKAKLFFWKLRQERANRELLHESDKEVSEQKENLSRLKELKSRKNFSFLSQLKHGENQNENNSK